MKLTKGFPSSSNCVPRVPTKPLGFFAATSLLGAASAAAAITIATSVCKTRIAVCHRVSLEVKRRETRFPRELGTSGELGFLYLARTLARDPERNERV